MVYLDFEFHNGSTGKNAVLALGSALCHTGDKQLDKWKRIQFEYMRHQALMT